MPFPTGISQLTGDVTAGPGEGAVAAALQNTTAVSNTVGALASVSTEVTRRSATATAALGECTEFTGSTASQTITLPNPGASNNGVYRIVNNASVEVSILGGTNSISIYGTIYSASTPVSVPIGTGLDFAYDQTGIWVAMGVTRPRWNVLALSANSATPAINTDNYNVVHITAQTAAITSFTTNLTGTPTDGQTLRISITGTASVALTWGASFESSTMALPTTTSSTARLDVGFVWNTETSKWRCVAVA